MIEHLNDRGLALAIDACADLPESPTAARLAGALGIDEHLVWICPELAHVKARTRKAETLTHALRIQADRLADAGALYNSRDLYLLAGWLTAGLLVVASSDVLEGKR